MFTDLTVKLLFSLVVCFGVCTVKGEAVFVQSLCFKTDSFSWPQAKSLTANFKNVLGAVLSDKVLNKHWLIANTPPLATYSYLVFFVFFLCDRCLNALFLPKDHAKEAKLTYCEWRTEKRVFVASELSVSALDKSSKKKKIHTSPNPAKLRLDESRVTQSPLNIRSSLSFSHSALHAAWLFVCLFFPVYERSLSFLASVFLQSTFYFYLSLYIQKQLSLNF